MKTFVQGIVVGLIAAAVLVAAVHSYRQIDPRPSVPAPLARELRNQPTQAIAIASVQAFAAPTKKALGLPPAVQASPDAHVVAATKLSPSERPRTVTAVLDAHTGSTALYIRNDPLPWLAFERRGEASLSGGMRGGAQVYRLSARQDLLQIKAAHVGLVGSLDSDGQWFAGVGVRVVW